MASSNKPVRCRWCGKMILWTTCGGKRIPLDNALTYYKRTGRPERALYTGAGTKILCEVLPDERAGEADGSAHEYHFCPKKPIYHRPKPLTRRVLMEQSGLWDDLGRR